MNILSTLKNLPLVSVLAVGMALSPTLSMADNDKGGRDKGRYSHDGGKTHVNSHSREGHRYNKYGNKHRSMPPRGKSYGHHDRGHGQHRGHNDHIHTNVIVHDYAAYDYARRHYLSLDDLRFTFGLHTNNLDIILRD